jgi:cation:H+ antiporter
MLYVLGVKYMASSDNEPSLENSEESAITIDLTLKQIIFRFIITSIGLVISSIFITYATDIISVKLNLGTGLAGALFLGIATSLPEVTSCISLVKIKNYNVTIGNVVGSNLFNFVILFIADVLYLGEGIYNFSEYQTRNLLYFGAIATILTIIILMAKNRIKNNILLVICSIGVILSYLLFLTL